MWPLNSPSCIRVALIGAMKNGMSRINNQGWKVLTVNTIDCVGVRDVTTRSGNNWLSARPFVSVSEMSQPLVEIPGR